MSSFGKLKSFFPGAKNQKYISGIQINLILLFTKNLLMTILNLELWTWSIGIGSGYSVLTSLRICYRTGKLRRISEYAAQNQAGWLTWGYNTFVKNPFMWSVNKLLQRSQGDGSGQYVVVEVLQVRCEKEDYIFLCLLWKLAECSGL